MKTTRIIHVFLVLGLLALSTTFIACEKGLECKPVVVNSGCKARCARVIQKDGKDLMCTDQVFSTSTGENAILQRQTQKVITKRLDAEVCFAVVDRKVADEAIRKELGIKCQAP